MLVEEEGSSMAHTVRVMPILPGKENEARIFSDELLKERRNETDAFYARYGCHGESWSLQETPMGLIGIVCTDIDDLVTRLESFGQSKHPFDAWFRSRIRDITGLDLTQPMQGDPSAEQIFEWRPD